MKTAVVLVILVVVVAVAASTPAIRGRCYAKDERLHASPERELVCTSARAPALITCVSISLTHPLTRSMVGVSSEQAPASGGAELMGLAQRQRHELCVGHAQPAHPSVLRYAPLSLSRSLALPAVSMTIDQWLGSW